MNQEYTLFDRGTQAIFWNLNFDAIQRMLDYDYMIGRNPSVVAIVGPNSQRNFEKFFYGNKEILIPIYDSLKKASVFHPQASVLLNFASFRSAYEITKEALALTNIKVIVITAEGVPERFARELSIQAKKLNKWIIGPASVGGIKPYAFKIANTGGAVENIKLAKLFKEGSVGIVTRSGGLLNELFNIVSQYADGVAEGIAIGGDKFPGTEFVDHLIRFERNPKIKFSIMIGEVGGKSEYKVIEAIKNKLITKPIIGWCIGTVSDYFGGSIQFGHAGAKADKASESAVQKNKAMKQAGIFVPNGFNQLPYLVKELYESLTDNTVGNSSQDINIIDLPLDCETLVKTNKARKKTHFVCTISNDTKEEITYCNMPITEIVEKKYTVTDIIGLLWFKQKFPVWASNFIDLIIKLTADHGPAVSGAHNTRVTARAGKDLTASIASGILTIGPRFGGAIDAAAKYFKMAYENKMEPEDFVEYMKNVEKIPIPGIGHRIKSTKNPDKRVSLLKNYVFNKFPTCKLINYALDVEKVTTSKKENLILNVDGAIGVSLVDMFWALNYKNKDIDNLIQRGAFNAFFVIGRTIGLIGHYLDEKRLNMPLYRHPVDDILYDEESPIEYSQEV
ncbi:MAG: citrate/2-methylcitrate synthase [Desulfurella sp.]|uniref:citrate/2-methylcitrate synthase n=2 Tax=Desulfurella sp. TaxID=1962857 RepID=UPI003D0DB62F